MAIRMFTILLILNWELRYPRKREGNRKWVRWNGGLIHLCSLVLELQENFMQSLSVVFCYYYCFFWGPKQITTSSISFYPLIIGFFWFAKLWLKLEEKIHTKVTVNVSRGGEVLEDVLHGSGANDLPWWRKGLPWEPREEWNYTD